MADPSPAAKTAAQPSQSGAITGPQVMTQWQARRRVGWMSTIDFIFMWGLLVIALVVIAWCFFGWPTAAQLIGTALGVVIYLLLWVILLLYRSMLFTLGVHADIQLMPAQAARMAVAHITGQARRTDEHPDAKT